MEKLMKPAEYAKALGISRQAVYAKIKRGMLKAKEVEGKLYIVVDEAALSEGAPPPFSTPSSSVSDQPDYEALLAAKDETIAVLKETVSDLKESHRQISSTLRGEIELLKEAFGEMRALYKMQLEHKKRREDEARDAEAFVELVTEAETEESDEAPCTMGLKKLFKRYGITKEKKREKLRKRLEKAWEKGDIRIVREGDKLRVLCDAAYDDLID